VAWQRADDLFIKLHQLSLKAFPAHERFELGSQIRRAAYSVAANIVEIESEIRTVGAPLVGLIRSTRSNVTAQFLGAGVLIVIGATWLS